MKVTVERAAKDMVPDGISYNELLEHAINATNMARLGLDGVATDEVKKERARKLLIIRLAQEEITIIDGAVIALVLHHAQMITAGGKEEKKNG